LINDWKYDDDVFIIVAIQRVVYGGQTLPSTVSNPSAGCTRDDNSEHTQNSQTKLPTKVTLMTTTTMATTSTTTTTNTQHRQIVDQNRVNWWTGLRTMWKRAETTLRTPRKKFIRLQCMRRRRERLEIILSKPFRSLSVSSFHLSRRFPSFQQVRERESRIREANNTIINHHVHVAMLRDEIIYGISLRNGAKERKLTNTITTTTTAHRDLSLYICCLNWNSKTTNRKLPFAFNGRKQNQILERGKERYA